MSLTPRQKQILGLLTREFILTAEPVSSSTLEGKLGNLCSSATIRSEMAELEKRGFLQRPHIASGRVPSHQGYRYYVDHLMNKEELSLEEQYTIKLELNKRIYQIDQLLDKTLDLISHHTKELSILVPPNFKNIVIKDIHLISINPYSILIVIVTTTGLVINKIIENPTSVSESEIEVVLNFLKERLEGITADKIDNSLLEGQEKIAGKHLLKPLVDEIKKSLFSEMEKKVLWVGTQNLMSKPEFRNVDKIKTLLDMLDNHQFAELIDNKEPANEVRVTIGQEHKLKEFYDCSIITAYYRVEGEVVGNLGILGPTRMHYGKMVPLISFIAKSFSKMLNRLNC